MSDIIEIFRDLQSLNYKVEYDDLVLRYKELVYPEFLHGISPNSTFTPSIIDYPDMADVYSLVDNWVTQMVSSLWDFSAQPFTLYYNDLIDPFINNIAKQAARLFSVPSTNFRNSLSQVTRDWIEFGIGVFTFTREDDEFFCSTHYPEYTQFRLNERDEAIEVVTLSFWGEGRASYDNIKNRDTTRPKNMTNYTRYAHYERIKRGKWKVKYYDSNYKADGFTITKNVIVNYTPVFILRFNSTTKSVLGVGKAFEALPILTLINNIQKKINEVADTIATPTFAFKNNSIVPSSGAMPGLKNLICELDSRIILYNDVDTLRPIQFAAQLAPLKEQMLEYVSRIKDMFSPNKMIVAKGIARMTAEETRIRNSYDKTYITNKSAILVDDLLYPIIIQVIKVLFDVPLMKDQAKLYDMDFIDISLNNIRSDEQSEQRLAIINSSIAVLQNVIGLGEKMKLNVQPLVEEIESLSNIDIKPNVPQDLLASLDNYIKNANRA